MLYMYKIISLFQVIINDFGNKFLYRGDAMTDLFVNLFVKNPDDINNPIVRRNYGLLSGFVGIGVNVLLCIAKIFAGTLTHSIAITGDAVHNLADAGSSVVTVFGFIMAGKPADDKHPFGHGRVEYVTAMIVSFIILFMGGELAIQSIGKIRNPVDVKFSVVSAIIVGVSIFAKIWLAFFNRGIGKKINSPAMTAVVADSISDSIATSTTLVSLILSAFFPKLHIDGWAGLIVSGFVIRAGFEVFRDTLGAIIGEPPERETVEELKHRVRSYDYVAGIHDLMIHNYGPGRFFASIHVEMPSDLDVMKAHDIIDKIERDIRSDMEIELTIHYDPVRLNDERTNQLSDLVQLALAQIDERMTMHDFRIVDGEMHTNLIFDVVVPYKSDISGIEIKTFISDFIKKENGNCFCIINIEHSFV